MQKVSKRTYCISCEIEAENIDFFSGTVSVSGENWLSVQKNVKISVRYSKYIRAMS
jgi:hypothetical protein